MDDHMDALCFMIKRFRAITFAVFFARMLL